MTDRSSLLATLALVWTFSVTGCSRGASSDGARTDAAVTVGSAVALASASAKATVPAATEASPPAAKVDLDEKGPLRGVVANAPIALPHGGATVTEVGVELTLTSEPFVCDRPPTTGTRVSVELPASPTGTFDAGRAHGVRVAFAPPDDANAIDIGASFGRLTTEAVSPLKGSHIRGTLFTDDGTGAKMLTSGRRTTLRSAVAGTFDVVICDDQRGKQPRRFAPSPPVAAVVKGTIGGSPFEARSTLAFVFKDRGLGVDYASSVSFFSKAGVTCANQRTQEGVSVAVNGPGGARGDAPLLKTMQVAKPVVETRVGDKTSSSGSSSQRAWMILDKVDLSPTGQAQGSIVVSTLVAPSDPKDDLRLAGRFTASVCHLGAFPP